MIVTTTDGVEGKRITCYHGLVFCYSNDITDGAQELERRAHSLGANAVVGVVYAGTRVESAVDYTGDRSWEEIGLLGAAVTVEDA